MLPKAVLLNLTIKPECVTNIHWVTIFDVLFGIVPGRCFAVDTTFCHRLYTGRKRSTIYFLPLFVNGIGIFRLNCLEAEIVGFFCFLLKRLLYLDMLITSRCVVAVLLGEFR